MRSITIALTLGATTLAALVLTFISTEQGSNLLQQVTRPRRASDSASRVMNVNPGESLQAALNNAVPGDTIKLKAGASYKGNFTLPKKAGTGYVTVQSSRISELLQDTRVSPEQAPLLAKLESATDGEPIIKTAPGAHHYRFIGLEISTVNAGVKIFTLVELGSSYKDQNTLNVVPHDIIFDRCYIHGFREQPVQRGIALNSAETSVLNSWISDIHWDIDTQALCGWNGPGPFHIINNYLEAAGENVMFGGATVHIAGMIPSDIEIRRNHFFKPLSWKVGDSSYRSPKWTVKNHFELKNARRVTVDGNLFENCWGDGQTGFSVVLTPRQDPYAVVEDVTLSNNLFRNVEGGINFLGVDNYGGGPQQTRIKIINNLFERVGREPLFQISNLNDLVIDHNTALHLGTIVTHYGKSTTRFIFTNNIVERNHYGIIGTGDPPIEQYFPDAVITANVVVTQTPEYFQVRRGNYFPKELGEVGFVDLSQGNYKLSATSRYKGKGLNGKDPGVDVSVLRQP